MSQRDALVRGYARAMTELVGQGITAGGAWIQGRTPIAFHRLVKSIDRERLYAILDDERHPDRGRGIARELAGVDSFAALIPGLDVDYTDAFFLGGFVQGVLEEIDAIPRESIDQMKLKRQDEIDLMAEYLPARNTRLSDLFRASGRG
jgi:hypothetical protein